MARVQRSKGASKLTRPEGQRGPGLQHLALLRYVLGLVGVWTGVSTQADIAVVLGVSAYSVRRWTQRCVDLGLLEAWRVKGGMQFRLLVELDAGGGLPPEVESPVQQPPGFLEKQKRKAAKKGKAERNPKDGVMCSHHRIRMDSEYSNRFKYRYWPNGRTYFCPHKFGDRSGYCSWLWHQRVGVVVLAGVREPCHESARVKLLEMLVELKVARGGEHPPVDSANLVRDPNGYGGSGRWVDLRVGSKVSVDLKSLVGKGGPLECFDVGVLPVVVSPGDHRALVVGDLVLKPAEALAA